MSTTAALVEQGHNHLRYLLTADGEGGALTITTTGAVSPDLLTDSIYGPVKQCALAFTNGIGKLAAGALTQAQSRAIWMADNSDTVLGNGKVSRCQPRITRRSGGDVWIIDADVDGGGHPTIVITPTGASPSTAYLDIYKPGPIGL